VGGEKGTDCSCLLGRQGRRAENLFVANLKGATGNHTIKGRGFID